VSGTTRHCAVAGCNRSTHDAYVCSSCARSLSTLLSSYPATDELGDPGVRALVADLEVSLARASRVGPGPGAQSSETPLAFGYHAGEALWLLGNTLGTWARDLAEQRAIPLPLALIELATWPRAVVRRTVLDGATIAACAWFLVAHENDLRQLPDAGEAHEAIRAAYAQAVAAVDRAPERTYLVCEHCGRDILADPTQAQASCRSCGWSHSVTRRKDAMLQEVRAHLGTATEIARLLGKTFGIEVSTARISQWWQRGTLAPRGKTPTGRNLYRIGDVIDRARHG
jgi:DNA-directed RNA polymerase subunit RPC12/RpoP